MFNCRFNFRIYYIHYTPIQILFSILMPMGYYENVMVVNRFRFELIEVDPGMFKKYGTDRVLEPKSVLPTSAWRVDNSREINPNEIRAVSYTHLRAHETRHD